MGKKIRIEGHKRAPRPRRKDGDDGMAVPIILVDETQQVLQEEEQAHLIFSINLILEEIIYSLEYKDRLTCSLVSREWNELARGVLRKSGECFAAIKDVEGGERDVIQLSSMIRSIDNSPFSGLSVHVYERRALRRRNNEESEADNNSRPPSPPNRLAMRRAVTSILEDLGPHLKYVKLTSEQMLAERHCCGSEHSMVKLCRNWGLSYLIIESLAPSLEGILIDFYYERGFPGGSEMYAGKFLPNVRTVELKCNEKRVTSRNHGKFLQSLMEACSGLQNLRVDVPPSLLNQVVFLSEARLIQQFDFYPSLQFLDSTLELATRRPGLKKLFFTTQYDKDEDDYTYDTTIAAWSPQDQQKVRQALVELLQSSANTLEKLSLDHLDLILIVSQWDIPVMSRLKRLDLVYNLEIDASHDFALEKINLTEHFPLLQQVSVQEAPHERRSSLEFFVNAQLKNQTARYSCLTVTTLRLKINKTLRIRTLDRLTRLFPNVKHFHLELNGTRLQTFPIRIWTLWPDLESLSLTSLKLDLSNCDERILGVSRKDADRILAGLDDSELAGFIPVKNGIFGLSKLRRICFGVVHGLGCWPSRSSNPDSVFLSPTALKLIRSRIPGLQIELETEVCELFKENCHLYLKHLQPHVQSLKRVEITVKSDIQESDYPMKLGRR